MKKRACLKGWKSRYINAFMRFILELEVEYTIISGSIEGKQGKYTAHFFLMDYMWKLTLQDFLSSRKSSSRFVHSFRIS